jgi:hypothetical protein
MYEYFPLLPVGTDYLSQEVILQCKNEDSGYTRYKKKVLIAILPYLVHVGLADNEKMIIE